jgi:hypothetical protein
MQKVDYFAQKQVEIGFWERGGTLRISNHAGQF